MRGDLTAGDRLSVPDLARTLNVSRTPVREAIYSLERAGLVVVRPRRGAVVFGGGREVLQPMLELREALDGMAARLAAERMTEDERQALRTTWQAHDSALAAGQLDEHIDLDLQFHALVRDGAHNEPLSADLAKLRDQMLLVMRSWSAAPGGMGRRTRRDHDRIAEAVLVGDADGAEDAARAHVRNISMFVLKPEHHGMDAQAAGA